MGRWNGSLNSGPFSLVVVITQYALLQPDGLHEYVLMRLHLNSTTFASKIDADESL